VEMSFSWGTPQDGIIYPFVFDVGIEDMALFVLFGALLNNTDDSTSLISARTSELLFANVRLCDSGCQIMLFIPAFVYTKS
jgi:hypothetical protein